MAKTQKKKNGVRKQQVTTKPANRKRPAKKSAKATAKNTGQKTSTLVRPARSMALGNRTYKAGQTHTIVVHGHGFGNNVDYTGVVTSRATHFSWGTTSSCKGRGNRIEIEVPLTSRFKKSGTIVDEVSDMTITITYDDSENQQLFLNQVVYTP